MQHPSSAAPYGLWPSPLSPSQLAQSKRLQDVAWDGDRLVWLEGRSAHGMVVALDAGESAPRDITPDLSVRARVGYGGGDMAVHAGQVVFSAEGRLHRQSLTQGPAQPITPAFGDWAAPAISPSGRWVAAVHSSEGVDCLALVDLTGQRWPARLASGARVLHAARLAPARRPAGLDRVGSPQHALGRRAPDGRPRGRVARRRPLSGRHAPGGRWAAELGAAAAL